jgi:putative autoinducer-2 (AI-2) aldolase
LADIDGLKEAKDFGLDRVTHKEGEFFLKGMNHYGWGLKTRLSRIFNPESGNTVMLAFDHGYIMGPTSGLERLDIAVPPLIPHVDALMATRGALRSCVEPNHGKGIVLRSSAGGSVLDEDMSFENRGVGIDDAIRMSADCMAIQVFIGGGGQVQSLKNLTETIDEGNRFGIPTLGVVAVGKEMERTTRYFLLATRMIAELGAHIVKTYYCEDFEKVTAACPVPIVVAGGKKVPEKDALELAFRAMDGGALGVDMGRNIFQAEYPSAMVQAIGKIVHHNFTVNEAYQLYQDLSR